MLKVHAHMLQRTKAMQMTAQMMYTSTSCIVLLFSIFVLYVLCIEYRQFGLKIYIDSQDDASRRVGATDNGSRNRTGSTQKAMSLPSSPHEYRGQVTEKSDDFMSKEKMALAWNKVFQSSPFLNKPLLPFEEWNIDFSEITIGTRVGIGK